MAPRRRTSPLPKKPTTAREAAPKLRTFLVKLFDKGDGQAADWPLLAETLLVEAFHALDQAKGDPRTAALLRRMQAGVYDRLAGNEPDVFMPSTPGQGRDALDVHAPDYDPA